MKPSYLIAAALAAALAAAPVAAQNESVPADTVLMTINGYEVTPEVLLAYRGLRPPRAEPRDPQQAQLALINEIATILMISQDGEARGVDKKPEHATLLDISRRIALSEAVVQEVVTEFEVTDELIKELYDRKYGEMPREYRARHILVKEEDKAKELIGELGSGADFAELAKEHSTDPGSGARGGDLGWFAPDRMVPPFAEAVVAQEPGVVSKEPVQSQFGYHIILVEESREQTPPELETVREQLSTELRQIAVTTYVNGLRDSTEIQVSEMLMGPQDSPAASEAGN